MGKGYRVSAPFLTDDEKEQAVRKGGLSGGEESNNTIRGMLLGLRRLPHVYEGPVPVYVTEDGRRLTPGRRLTEMKIWRRRARNKQARISRRINRSHS